MLIMLKFVTLLLSLAVFGNTSVVNDILSELEKKAYGAQVATTPVIIHNDDPSSITTIVGCDHKRNTDQPPDRTQDTTISCADLLAQARKIAQGSQTCEHGLGPSPPGTNFTGCKYNGEVVKVHVHNGPHVQSSKLNAKSLKAAPPMGCASGMKSGYNIKSVYTEEIIGNWRVIATNGIPNHNYDQYTPNTPCETYRIMVIKTGRKSGGSTSATTPMGAIGISKSGAFLFNYLSAEPVCRVAAITEFPTFGKCVGHCQMNGFWHYHSPSSCLTTSASDTQDPGETNPCLVIGYTVDGLPVRDQCPGYTPCYNIKASAKYTCTAEYVNDQGKVIKTVKVFPGCDPMDYDFTPTKPGCTLDDFNGAMTGDQYTYYVTNSTTYSTSFPYILPKWHYVGNEGYFCTITA